MTDAWADFCVAQVGASAALAGLVFVGVTINLDDIIASPPLPNRALRAILVLATVLFECSTLLTVHTSRSSLGWTILSLGLASCLGLALINIDIYRKTAEKYRGQQLLQILPSQCATVSFVVAGTLVLMPDGGGLGWFLPGTLFCYGAALSEAWVLLIEIKR